MEKEKFEEVTRQGNFVAWDGDNCGETAVAYMVGDAFFDTAINCMRAADMGNKDKWGVYDRVWLADSVYENNNPRRANLTEIAMYMRKTGEDLNMEMMSEDLKYIADMITENIISAQKEMLTSDEAARYMGVAKSYLYKLTMKKQIPHYKPIGKMCYFKRAELEQWLQNNRINVIK